MPDEVVTPLTPEDSFIEHPKVEPIQVKTDLISGNDNPHLEDKVSYSGGDYFKMALPFVRQEVLDKMTGVPAIPFASIFHWVVIIFCSGLLIYSLFKVGIL